MTEAVAVALIVAVPGVLTALLVGWKSKHEIQGLGRQVLAVELKLDGRLEELLRLAKVAGVSEGGDAARLIAADALVAADALRAASVPVVVVNPAVVKPAVMVVKPPVVKT